MNIFALQQPSPFVLFSTPVQSLLHFSSIETCLESLWIRVSTSISSLSKLSSSGKVSSSACASSMVRCTRDFAAPIRPLQINSLFPVHRPHLITVSSEYSIIPYSSSYSCILYRLNKSYLVRASALVTTVLSSCFFFVFFLQINDIR